MYIAELIFWSHTCQLSCEISYYTNNHYNYHYRLNNLAGYTSEYYTILQNKVHHVCNDNYVSAIFMIMQLALMCNSCSLTKVSHLNWRAALKLTAYAALQHNFYAKDIIMLKTE